MGTRKTGVSVLTVVLWFLAGLLWASACPAGVVLFQETFSVDVPEWDGGTTRPCNANVPPAYQHLAWDSPNVNDIVMVSGNGVAKLNSYGGGWATVGPPGPFSGDITFSADLNLYDNTTGYNVGLQLGDLMVLFHTAGTGHYRIVRVSTNTKLATMESMPWLPVGSTTGSLLHHLEVEMDTVNRVIAATLTKGDDPTKTAQLLTSYDAADYVPGTSLLAARRGASGWIWVDNLTVEGELPPAAPVSEPAGLSLLALAALGLRRRRR